MYFLLPLFCSIHKLQFHDRFQYRTDECEMADFTCNNQFLNTGISTHINIAFFREFKEAKKQKISTAIKVQLQCNIYLYCIVFSMSQLTLHKIQRPNTTRNVGCKFGLIV